MRNERLKKNPRRNLIEKEKFIRYPRIRIQRGLMEHWLKTLTLIIKASNNGKQMIIKWPSRFQRSP